MARPRNQANKQNWTLEWKIVLCMTASLFTGSHIIASHFNSTRISHQILPVDCPAVEAAIAEGRVLLLNQATDSLGAGASGGRKEAVSADQGGLIANGSTDPQYGLRLTLP